MTRAKETYKLSKLDLFTPNRLHPSLPPLAVGEFPANGIVITMISEPDVLTRCNLIYSRLGEKISKDPAYLRRRCAAHERLITHMDVFYCLRRRTWIAAGKFERNDFEKTPPKYKSMQTKKSRNEYVEKGLRKEWAAMGVGDFMDS